MGEVPRLTQLSHKYRERDFEFLVIYVRESHPGDNFPHHRSVEQDERLKREAGLLAHLDQVADLIRWLAGFDVDMSFEPESTASQRPLECGALHAEARDLFEPDRLDVKLCHGPEPGQLGEHSKGDAGAEVRERGRSCILPRKIGSLVTND